MLALVLTQQNVRNLLVRPYLTDKIRHLLSYVRLALRRWKNSIVHPKLMMGGVRSFKYSPMYDALTERPDATQTHGKQIGDLERCIGCLPMVDLMQLLLRP